MITSISSSITQNAGQPQNIGQPTSSSSGTGGLADSPWPMFRQNLNHTGVSPYDTSSNPGKLKWSFTTGYDIFSSPAIGSDGTIYIGSEDNKLYAISPAGAEKWSFIASDDIFSSPAIGSDGTIYIGCKGGKLYAINPDGTEKWSFTTGDYIHSSAAIGPDRTIYFGSDDYKLYAINPDGSKKWSYTTGGRVLSSPAIGSDGTIYVGSEDNKLFAINPDGTKKWDFTTGMIVRSSPAISSEGIIYVGSYDHNLYAINPDGTKKWSYSTDGWVMSSPAIGSDGTIYVGSYDNKLYAIGGNLSLNVNVTSHFSELNSAAQSAITVHVTDGTNPVQGASVNLVSDNGGMFSPQSGITDANGDFNSIFNAPNVTSQIICRILGQVSKTGYNDGSGYVEVTINPIPWPMFRHNLNHTGQSPYDTSSNPGKLKWKFLTGAYIYSPPSIGSDGTIYVGSYDNRLYAINPDGTEKWSFITGNEIGSSPTIGSDGIIYVSSYDGKLYAIYPDGTEKWNFKTSHDLRCSPAIGSEGTIFLGTQDNKIYAINPNGTEKWSFIINGSTHSSPAIGSDGMIYIGTIDNKLYAINPDGTEKWNFITGGDVFSSPAIGSMGVVYFGSYDNKLYAINQDGTEKWSFITGGDIWSSPAIGSDGTIYIGSNDGKLYAINPDGTQKWNITIGPWVISSPAIGSDGTIYIGSGDNNLYAINPDGTEKWRYVTGNAIISSPAIDSDGTIFIGSRDYYLHAIGEGGIPPIADAGPDQAVNEGDVVQFDGRESYDPDLNFSFGPEVMVNDNADCVGSTSVVHPGIAVDDENNIYVVWRDYREIGPNIYFARSTDGGITFSKNIKINDENTSLNQTGGDHYSPSITIDDNGTKYNVWSDGSRGKNYDIYFTKSTDGGNTFIPNVRIDDTGGYLNNKIHPSIKIYNGTIYVVWADDRNERYNRDIYFSKSTDGGMTWSSNIRVDDTGDGPNSQLFPNIDISDEGEIYIVWTDVNLSAFNYEASVFFSASFDGGHTFSPSIKINAKPDSIASHADIAVDNNGVIYVVRADWSDINRYDVLMTKSTDKGSTFSNDTMINSEVELDQIVSWHSIVADRNNNIHVVWYAGGSPLNEVYYAKLSNGSNSFGPNYKVNSDPTTMVMFPSIAVGKEGTPYIVWKSLKDNGWNIYFSKGSKPHTNGLVYQWDFDVNVDSDGDGNTTNDIDSTSPTPTHIYGDDGVYIVTLRVTDNDNLSATDTCNITVQNVDPTVTIESITMNVEIGLRVAGRKYNNVSMTLYEDGSQLGYVSIERMPGSPNEQMAWIPVNIDFSKSYSATVTYTLEDPPNVGGNPIWIYIKSPNGSIKKIHHTFNVQQSKKRDSEHWNHIEPWEVDLSTHFIGLPFEITSHVMDPGSDDEMLTYTYGSQVETATYLNNPPNPDPYPSPEVNPVDITDTTTLVYEGPGTVTLVVKDDDNIRLGVGEGYDSFSIG